MKLLDLSVRLSAATSGNIYPRVVQLSKLYMCMLSTGSPDVMNSTFESMASGVHISAAQGKGMVGILTSVDPCPYDLVTQYCCFYIPLHILYF